MKKKTYNLTSRSMQQSNATQLQQNKQNVIVVSSRRQHQIVLFKLTKTIGENIMSKNQR